MSELGLEVTGLRVSYPGRAGPLKVLGGVELRVRRGELLSLVGPSGCGKTTLLHAIMGLLSPTAGTVNATGRPALVFQRPQLLPWRTVLHNATFGLECQGQSHAEVAERAEALLARMGLSEHLHDHPHQLSEGMQQRVNLARALLVEPQLLLLDEPFSALDVRTRRALQDDLLALWEERELTVILVSHSLEDVAYLSDRVGVLSAKPATISSLTEVELPRPRAGDPQATLALLEEVRRLEALFDG